MIKKILIANRGEIAIRIMRTVAQLGMKSVAIYSSADRFSMHASMADEAYCVGLPEPQHSYLNIEKIINIALQTQVDAIHPGYGFLSENPDFARACEKNNIIFIGPTSQAMADVGSKQRAKELLQQTSVPMIEGYHAANPSDEELLDAAHKIGFPLVIKAAHGGGGKGLKIVHNSSEWQVNLQSARREAKKYFNNDELLLEKFIDSPRHLEVQVFGDHHGNLIHLFERDCSVQRRQQKIIEEAPAVNLSPKIRKKLYQYAIEVAKKFAYTNAGTVEFLLTTDNKLYFMEMNARLQVEHPITEAITGIDLVDLQINIAQGHPIPFLQPLQPKGHAIECRICAEQPKQDFKPSQGQINNLSWPKDGRVDTGVSNKSIIHGHYDSLLAKEITIAETRKRAIYQMQKMLHATTITGVDTNLNYLSAILKNPIWAKGGVAINFLATENLFPFEINPYLIILAGCAIEIQGKSPLTLFSNTAPLYWPLEFSLDNILYNMQIVDIAADNFTVLYESQRHQVFFSICAQQLCIEFAEKSYQLKYVRQKNITIISTKDHSYELHQSSNKTATLHNQTLETKIRAPMAATIVAVYKKTGDEVKKGDALVVLEAMKMEHTIYAPENGHLTALFFTEGQQIQDGSELLELCYEA